MIKFFNIKTGETRVIDPSLIDPTFVEPAISALYNSGNLHVNATRGQDFGWRLSPETIKRIRDIKIDDVLMNRIATSIQRPLEDITEADILTWIAKDDARKEAAKNQQAEGDFSAQYEEELRALNVAPVDQGIPSVPQEAAPTKEPESEEDLEAQTAAAAKKNEKTPEQKKKEQEEEDRLLAELEAEEKAEEEAKAAEAEKQADAGSEQAPEKQEAAEENTTEAPKTVAKNKPKADNKSNS